MKLAKRLVREVLLRFGYELRQKEFRIPGAFEWQRQLVEEAECVNAMRQPSMGIY